MSAALAIGAFGLSTPAYATPADDLNEVDVAIQAAEEYPGTGPLEDAEVFEQAAGGGLEHVTDTGTVSVDDSSIIELDTSAYAPLLIDANLPGEAGISDSGTAVWSSDQGYSMAPLPHDDGSVQIITVIKDASAPEQYDFSVGLEDGSTLAPQEDGSVVILNSSGSYAGFVAAPWAYDANGVEVPTHFDVDGDQLVQTIEHGAGQHAYPITADPYLGNQLFQWITADNFNGDIRVNLQPTTYGQYAPPWVMTGAGWTEAINWSSTISGYLQSKPTMRQQFDCHSFGNAIAGQWNLERFRYNRTVVWSSGVATHRCNWTTPDGV